MFAQAHNPEKLTLTELDTYLERGWFRMGQSIFTTNFIRFKSNVYSTIWLRVVLDDFLANNTESKLIKRNARFRTNIQPATLTDEKEDLYTRYRNSLPFQPSDSLHNLLIGHVDVPTIYQTFEITIHHGNQLIAIGFFDMGKTSAAGIISVYDPDYKKYSLGKYLIYLKIHFCKSKKLRYFYPGYFVPGYPFFDYKLTLAKPALQFLQLSSQKWLGIGEFSQKNIPYQVMLHKLLSLQKLLAEAKIESSILKYEFFGANLIPDLSDAELFDFPLFLFCPAHSEDGFNPVIVFDVCDAHFRLLRCQPIWKPNEINPDGTFYSSYYIKSVQELGATRSAEEISNAIVESIKSSRTRTNP
jgi:leucyl-tRNA---protein transferase